MIKATSCINKYTFIETLEVAGCIALWFYTYLISDVFKNVIHEQSESLFFQSILTVAHVK